MLGKEAGNMAENKRSWVFKGGSSGTSSWNRSLQSKVKDLKTQKSITIDLPGVLDIKNGNCKITTSISYRREDLLDDFDIKSNHAKIYGLIKKDLGKLFQNAVVNSTMREYNFFDGNEHTETGALDERRRNEPRRSSQPVNENGKRERESDSESNSKSDSESDGESESDSEGEEYEEDDDDDEEDEEG
jgi:hypothetical protein